jgi:phosphoenolpyruvate carboxykinase (GTP)
MPVSLSMYLRNYLNFGEKLKKRIRIFGFNYFLKDGDRFLNSKEDKRVWAKWAVKRVENSVDAIYTPIGFIPFYDDLDTLFRDVLGKEYRKEDYEKQFTLKLRKYLEKTERMLNIYSKIENMPDQVLQELNNQKKRLEEYINSYGDTVSPYRLYKKL